MPLQGYTLLLSTARHTFDNALGTITEVFSGSKNVWPQEAVSHQGFSTAGVTLPLVRGLLGLEGDAINKSLFFSPLFPADWGNVKIHFAPNLSVMTKIQSFSINGEPAVFDTTQTTQTVQIKADRLINGSPLLFELDTVPSLEILPVISRTKVGNRNIGLKILSVRKKESSIVIKVEGLAKTDYVLRVLNPGMAKSVIGAVIKEGQLKITIPEGPVGEFVPHQVTIHIQK